MWWKKEPWCMALSLLMLISSAFCLDPVPGGKFVQYGRFIIGSRRTTNEAKDDMAKKLHDEYAGDTNGYQSDQPELREWSQMVKLKLRHLSPSVQCDNDSMSLLIQGSQVPIFLVEGTEGPVPLSQMPSHCGFSVKRARRDVALVAKYDGCNVVQQGNAYVLPLHILGAAVEMVCPVARPQPVVSCGSSAMVVNLGTSPDAVWLKVNGSWQPVTQASTCGFALEVGGGGLTLTAPYTSTCWRFEGAEMLLPVQYMDVELLLSCPAVLPVATALNANMQPGTIVNVPVTASKTTLGTTVAPAGAEQQMLHRWIRAVPYPYAVPWYVPYSQPGTPPVTQTTTTTPTTTVAPAGSNHVLPPWVSGMYKPSGYGMPWYFPYRQPGTTPTTTTRTTTVAPAGSKQVLPPWFSGMYKPSGYDMPWYFPYRQPGTTPTTTTRTTTVAPAGSKQVLPPWFSGMYKPSGYGMPWYFPYRHPGTTTTTRTTTVAPAGSKQVLPPWFSGMYKPSGYMPWYLPYRQPGTTPTTTTQTTTVAPAGSNQVLPPWFSGMYKPSGYAMPWYFPYKQPGTPPVTQTTPTTTTPTSANQQALPSWWVYNPSGYGMPDYLP